MTRNDGKPRVTQHAARPVRVAGSDLFTTGASRFDLRDPYHLIATMTWPVFFLCLVGSELLINASFALLYAAMPGAIANVRPGSFSDAFFFSIETLATVGYGAMVPASRYGHIVSAIEIICGMVYTAVVTGVIFIRFSKPKAKIIYAERPVVSHHNGCPTLMIRIANGRTHMLTDANLRLTAMMSETSPEGQRFRLLRTLELLRPEFPLFALTWTIMHRIDERSPLHGCAYEDLVSDNVRLFLSIQARDPALAAHVHDLKTYTAQSIAFGMRYVDSISWSEDGTTLADLGRIGTIEADSHHGSHHDAGSRDPRHPVR